MPGEAEALFAFPGVHGALAAEKALAEAGIAVRVMPLPGKLGRGCGRGIRIAGGEAARAAALCGGCAVYRRTAEGGDYERWFP
jgi:hypothetical protein